MQLLDGPSCPTCVMAMPNVFFKQKRNLKHIHTMAVEVVKVFVYLLAPYNIEPISEPTHTVLEQV